VSLRWDSTPRLTDWTDRHSQCNFDLESWDGN
jgi:hypothetical protein